MASSFPTIINKCVYNIHLLSKMQGGICKHNVNGNYSIYTLGSTHYHTFWWGCWRIYVLGQMVAGCQLLDGLVDMGCYLRIGLVEGKLGGLTEGLSFGGQRFILGILLVKG